MPLSYLYISFSVPLFDQSDVELENIQNLSEVEQKTATNALKTCFLVLQGPAISGFLSKPLNSLVDSFFYTILRSRFC